MITVAHVQPLVALLAGILILLVPAQLHRRHLSDRGRHHRARPDSLMISAHRPGRSAGVAVRRAG
jgi:hypothetical protein